MARKPVGMHVEDIKAELRKQFGTLAALSKRLGGNPNIVSCVLSQPGHSVPMERRIAEILGRLPQDVWPERYHADGSPVSFRAARIVTVSRDADQRANGVAA
jgi:Ner family transcriptional regulator